MFKLSRLTDYAVVVLAALEQSRPDHVAVGGLAVATNLPEPTISKVLKLLNKAGIVQSVRGASGGYALKLKTGDISVLDIVCAIEGPFSVVACVEDSQDSCALQGACLMYGRWGLVNGALKDALGSVTLADMLQQQAQGLSPHRHAHAEASSKEERVQ
jgi:FeS assembly SUF system regulator